MLGSILLFLVVVESLLVCGFRFDSMGFGMANERKSDDEVRCLS